MIRTAIYARISSDDGTALGVARQVEDCRKLAAELGWQVVDEYEDNDVSAYSGKKRRPAYEAMLAEGSVPLGVAREGQTVALDLGANSTVEPGELVLSLARASGAPLGSAR
mgnify:CR=1 FL=1